MQTIGTAPRVSRCSAQQAGVGLSIEFVKEMFGYPMEDIGVGFTLTHATSTMYY